MSPSSRQRKVREFDGAQSTEAYALRDYLHRSVVAFDWVELSTAEDCRNYLGLPELGGIRLPMVELPNGRRLFAPSLREVAESLGWIMQPRLREYELSLYGAGPARLPQPSMLVLKVSAQSLSNETLWVVRLERDLSSTNHSANSRSRTDRLKHQNGAKPGNCLYRRKAKYGMGQRYAIIRDGAGYLITGPDLLDQGRPAECWRLKRMPYYLETSVPGSVAASDVRHRTVKRVASAVGEGAMAVTFVHRYLTEID